jgi:hypothetical protein
LINQSRLIVRSDLTIGNSAAHGAYSGGGELTVAGNLIIDDAGFADLGYLTEIIQFGSISAPNGIALPAGGDLILRDGGAVNGKLATAPGSTIVSGSNLPAALGDPNSVAGVSIGGELHVGDGLVELFDANLAELGALTTLGGAAPGRLRANNGVLIDLSDNITGYGTIESPDEPLKPVIVNGDARGNTFTERLSFTGHVRGDGRLDNVEILGTHSPGTGVGVQEVGDVTYAALSTLYIEIRGTAEGGYDQIHSDSILSLSGTLQLSMLGPVSFELGQTFAILTADNYIYGQFDSELLPALGGGLSFDVQYTSNAVLLNVVAASGAEGDFDLDGDVDGSDFLVWQRGEWSSPLSAGDLTAWKANYGADSFATTATPEPGAAALLAIGWIALASKNGIRGLLL